MPWRARSFVSSRLVAALPRLSSSSSSSSSRQRRCLHCSRIMSDLPGHTHPAFKLSASSDFVTQHNKHNTEQRQRSDNPNALRAARALSVGDVLHRFIGCGGADTAGHWTLQVGPAAHINLAHHILRNINHSCEPNVQMRGNTLEVYRAVAKEEELTLDVRFCCHCCLPPLAIGPVCCTIPRPAAQ